MAEVIVETVEAAWRIAEVAQVEADVQQEVSEDA